MLAGTLAGTLGGTPADSWSSNALHRACSLFVRTLTNTPKCDAAAIKGCKLLWSANDDY